jgi:hypothetical protein
MSHPDYTRFPIWYSRVNKLGSRHKVGAEARLRRA